MLEADPFVDVGTEKYLPQESVPCFAVALPGGRRSEDALSLAENWENLGRKGLGERKQPCSAVGAAEDHALEAG